ncbi:MBL fold metallo-hydrolase [Halalkalibacillus halophilus]|uniref:MBL fold metallo-hydrolase n=1 Tax=Halalkalibacillus halophilus TaxID=392827 RepID=UPI000411FF57|nr:MBL fold metallo-hydrolase [Halalkalibacillus halophilus]
MKQLNDSCYVFESAVNIGYVHKGNYGMLIDAGIDQSSIRKVIRELDEANLPITHLFITHAHADHYGGANYAKKKLDLKVIAPTLEAAILENSILEPIYMLQGNFPLTEIRNKFLEGPPVQVDITVESGIQKLDNHFEVELIATPGHSYHQLAVGIDGILYAADSYFGKEEILKHKIPFITSADQTLASLEMLLEKEFSGSVPGHGPYEENFKSTIQKNIEVHQDILEEVKTMVACSQGGITHENIVAEMMEKYHIKADQLSLFLLHRTAITAYITSLIETGEIVSIIKNYRWMYQLNE